MLSYYATGVFDGPFGNFLFFIVVMLGVLFVISIFLGVASAAKKAENDAKPVEKQIAVLIEKQYSTNALTASIDDVPAIFQLDDGRRVKLTLKAKSTLIVGDRGMLTWQGDQFLNFERIG